MSGLKSTTAWIVAVLTVVAAFGYSRYRQALRKADVSFETVRVDRGRVVARVTATGTLSPLVTVQVGSQVSGRIQKILVDFNSPVAKGQVLARIDPPLFEAALEQARANYAAAQGNLAKAQVEALDAGRRYQRARNLAESKLIAEADLDTAQANAEAAKAQVAAAGGSVEQARAALHTAEVNLAYTTIVSPIDGVVISRNVDVGQTVAASLQAPTLFVIARDPRKMQIDTSVAEADVGKLTPGMAAAFTVDAYPSERFTGTVRQIRNAPQTVQNVVTYDAVIDVDNSGLKFKPGMTANVTFVYAEKADVLRVANAALRFRPTPELLARVHREHGARSAGSDRSEASAQAGGQGPSRPAGLPAKAAQEERPDRRTVWVLRSREPVPVAIRTGVSDGTVTEVTEGSLREGDEIVTDAPDGTPGSRTPPGGPGAFRRIF